MNLKVEINRIYHHYKKWEDYNYNFYNNCTGKEKEDKIKKGLEMFNSEELTKKYMFTLEAYVDMHTYINV